MPPLQKDEKNRQDNSDELFLSEINVFDKQQSGEMENSTIFHGGMVKKIDTLLREHEKKTILKELISAQKPMLFPEEPLIELRTPLSKKVKSSTFQTGEKPELSVYKKPTMPDEFKTEFLTIHNPSFKFVSNLHFTEDVLLKKNPEDRHVELIDLSSLVPDKGDGQKESTLFLNKNSPKEKQAKGASATTHQSKKDYDKAKIYNLTSKNLDEKKIKELEKKQSYIPVDFEDKIQKLKEKEQRKLERQKDAEQKRKQKEQKEREKEEEKLRKLEEQKAKLEAKQKKKEEKKSLLEQLKKEAEEKKLLKKEAALINKNKLELATSTKEEKKQKKLETKLKAKQTKLEAKQKKKEEKEAMIKILEREAEEKKQVKEKTKHVECETIKKEVLPHQTESIKEQTFVDEDVIKVLLITDDLLGNLPEEVIDNFAQSEDFKLYEKVISKYKN